MPVLNLTRINTNQITDQCVTGVKLADGTLTGALFAPDISMASNVIIAGNLTVEGVYTYTNVASLNTQILDPLVVLNNGFASSPYADQGLVMERGTAPYNVAFIWNESTDKFELIYTTENGSTYGSINNAGYADLTVNSLTSNTFVSGDTILANVFLNSLSAGNIYLTGNVWTDNNTESFSTTTGSFVTKGGVGIAKNTNIGGNLHVAGNLTVLGNVTTVNSQTLNVLDSIVTLHTTDDNTPLTSDDGRYIGIKPRYWKSGLGDAFAFFGWNNSTMDFEYYSTAVENLGSVISGVYGTGKFGALKVANTTVSTNTTTGALTVAGGAGINGNLHVGNGLIINSNATTNDFVYRGAFESSLIWVSGSSGQMVFGGNASSFISDSKLTIDATNSMIIPKGSTGDRPITPVAGMVRYNTTLNLLEFYNGTKWKNTEAEFTVITDQQFTANGNVSVFTLANSATQNSVVVSINGILQFPGLSYTVLDKTLTFSENPRDGDVIDVRGLTTTTTITQVSSQEGFNRIEIDGNGINYFTGNITSANRWLMDTGAGNLIPAVTSNLTIGNVTNTVQEIYADSLISSAISSTDSLAATVGLISIPLDEFPVSKYRTAKYLISVKENSKYSSREVLLMHDDSSSYMTEIVELNNGFGNLIDLSTSIFGGNVYLTAISNTANIGNAVKLQKFYIPV